MSYELHFMSYELNVMGYELHFMSYISDRRCKLQVARCGGGPRMRVADGGGCRMRVAGCRCRLPINAEALCT